MATWMHANLLAAGAFGSIGMLGWAAVALVPLLIHLWYRRESQVSDWAAMEFLLAAVQEQSKRLRFEQWLLLLLRMAVPCVLALALADPIWQWIPQLGSVPATRPPQHHVLLVDTSYSMGTKSKDQTRLMQAQQFARNVANQSPQGDGFTLLRMSDPSRPVVASPAYDKSDLLAEIEGLNLDDHVADLASGLQLAQRTLVDVPQTHTRIQQQQLYIISDMGRNTWQVADQQGVHDAMNEISKVAQVVVADVGVSAGENWAVVASQRTTALPTVGRDVIWNVTIRRMAKAARTMCPVGMRIDGELVQQKTVDCVGESTTTTFRYRFDRAGAHRVSFHLPDDVLAADNQRFEVVRVREFLRILCIEGRAGASRNVRLALSPDDNPDVQIEVISDHRLSRSGLDRFDAVFCCNVGTVTRRQAAAMRTYVSRGGGMVWFLGDQTPIQNHNDMMGVTAGQLKALLPATLTDQAPYRRYALAPDDYQHPLISPFRGQESAGLLGTPIWSYIRLTPNSTQSRVALAFANGDPVIVEHQALGGTVVLVATAPSPLSKMPHEERMQPWNAWSVWPTFPPIVQELLAFVVRGHDGRFNVTVGQSIGDHLAHDRSDRHVVVEDPNQELHHVDVHEEPSLQSRVWNWAETNRSGFYACSVGGSEAPTSFAVNLSDYAESELTRVAIDDLPASFRQHAIEGDSVPAMAYQEDSPLFRTFLILLLVLLVCESMVACYFGSRR